jgi:hypothetical protein
MGHQEWKSEEALIAGFAVRLRQVFISKVAEPLGMRRLVRGSPVPLR